jgi:hypothetical protein
MTTATAAPVTSRAITAVMRTLYPAPVMLATRAAGTDFHLFLAAASAGYMGLGADRGNTWLASYLTTHLGAPVHVAAVKFSRASSRGGRTCLVTVRPGECPGAGCPAP